MSSQSAIEWCDATWNPVRGCVKVSPGCANCYAATFAERFRGVPGHAYEQGFDLRVVPEKLTAPLSWKKPRRIFVNSMSDLFQDGVPDDYIDQVFAVMALARQHTFQVLTKRADRMRAYVAAMTSDSQAYRDRWDVARAWLRATLLARGERASMGRPEYVGVIMAHQSWPLPNVWLGVSVENQHFADERIPLLLQTPAACRFVSCEPLLETINIEEALFGYPEQVRARERVTRDMATDAGEPGMEGMPIGDDEWQPSAPPLDWVIVGGESGAGARPFQVEWARSILASSSSAST